MKAVVFTMDAIFSLVITVVGISLLLFFQYYAQAPYSLHYSNAQAIFTNLASTSVDSVRNGSAIAKSLSNQYMGANETWPMFMGGQFSNSSNPIGPLYPILAYSFNPANTITTGIVAGYGNIYFAANSILYAVNATTNRTAWTTNTVSNVVSSPALYYGTIFYANATNLTAANANTNSILWTTNSIKSVSLTTPLLVYDNLVFFGSSDNKINAFFANNGTNAWSKSIGAVPVSIAIAGGSLAIKTSTNVVYVAAYSGALAPVPVTSVTYSSGIAPTTPAYGANALYMGNGATANAMYTNGTVVPGFPLGEASTISGVATYKNYTAYQTGSTVTIISPTGGTGWLASVPSYFGVNVVNATPLISGSMVYTLWTNGLAAENLTSGSLQWFARVSGAPSYSYMTLAYGRIYIEVNNRIYAYGSCYSPVHATLLYAVATMSYNGQGGCETALLNSVYPSANYTLFANSPSTNTIEAASFNGAKGYSIARNLGVLNTSYMSVSFWVNISAYDPSGDRLVNYGDNGGCLAPTTDCGWFVYLGSTGAIQFAIMANGMETNANGPTLSLNKWYMITGTYNGTSVDVYVNANTPSTTSFTGAISPASTNINLTIGAGRPSDSRYFTGNIANVQLYSQSLGVQQIAALYRGGAAGVPVKGYGLVSWYPLAGDTNDYAGFNTGFAVGSMKFITKTYTSPAFSNAYEVSRASTLLPVLNYTSGASNTISVGIYSWG